MNSWHTLARRVDVIAAATPEPRPAMEWHVDRLTPEQLETAARLRARLGEVGAEGLTPDELMEAAELRAVLTGEIDE